MHKGIKDTLVLFTSDVRGIVVTAIDDGMHVFPWSSSIARKSRVNRWKAKQRTDRVADKRL